MKPYLFWYNLVGASGLFFKMDQNLSDFRLLFSLPDADYYDVFTRSFTLIIIFLEIHFSDGPKSLEMR